jgi:hypothetical protein
MTTAHKSATLSPTRAPRPGQSPCCGLVSHQRRQLFPGLIHKRLTSFLTALQSLVGGSPLDTIRSRGFRVMLILKRLCACFWRTTWPRQGNGSHPTTQDALIVPNDTENTHNRNASHTGEAREVIKVASLDHSPPNVNWEQLSWRYIILSVVHPRHRCSYFLFVLELPVVFSNRAFRAIDSHRQPGCILSRSQRLRSCGVCKV